MRTGELRQAESTVTGFDKEEWRIPGYKMKMKEQHIIPYHTSIIGINSRARFPQYRFKPAS